MSTFARLTLLAALLAPGCGDPDLRLGHAALARGRYDEAVDAYRRARTRPESAAAADDGLGAAHRAQAGLLWTEGRCDDARTQVLAAEQTSAPVLADHQALYECDAAQGAPPDVQLAQLRRTVELGDNRASVLHALLRKELDLDNFEAALALAPHLERHFALTLADRRRLADVYEASGQQDAAYAQWLHLERADPADPLTRLKMAEFFEKRGDAGRAQDILRSLTVELPQNPVPFLRLAEFLRRRGDAGGARAMQAHADGLRGVVHEARSLRPLPRSRH